MGDIFIDLDKKNIIESLKKVTFGTVIVANRFKDSVDKYKLEYGHRTGPYIVIYNEGNKLYCIKGSGSKNVENLHVSSKFHIRKDCYKLSKDTVFDLRYIEILDYSDVLEIRDKLNFVSRKKIQKQLTILKNNGILNNYYFLNYVFDYEVGDIVKRDNKLYLIIDIENNTYTMVPVINESEDNKFIIVDKTKYFLDYEKIINITDNIPGAIMASSTRKQLLYISGEFKEYLKNKYKSHKLQVGSVIRSGNHFSYIYGEDSNKWLIFEVSKVEYPNSIPIKIDNKIYYTIFSGIREILKNNEFYINCGNATNEERKKISDLKRQKKNEKKNVKKFDNLKFRIGDIIKTRTLSDDYYIVIESYYDGVYCVRYDNLKKGIYNKEFFNLCFILKKGTLPRECYEIIDNKVIFNDNIKKLVLRD